MFSEMAIFTRCYNSHLGSRSALKICWGRMTCILLAGNASLCRAVLSLRKVVIATSGIFGSSVVQDTCFDLDEKTAHRRRRFSCANGSCNHSLRIIG